MRTKLYFGVGLCVLCGACLLMLPVVAGANADSSRSLDPREMALVLGGDESPQYGLPCSGDYHRWCPPALDPGNYGEGENLGNFCTDGGMGGDEGTVSAAKDWPSGAEWNECEDGGEAMHCGYRQITNSWVYCFQRYERVGDVQAFVDKYCTETGRCDKAAEETVEVDCYYGLYQPADPAQYSAKHWDLMCWNWNEDPANPPLP